MKQFNWKIIFLMCHISIKMAGQSLSGSPVQITSRDTARMNNNTETLIKVDYQALLNSIVSKKFDEDEIFSEIIKPKVFSNEQRLFYNKDVRVECDYIPGNDTLSVPDEQKVEEYLTAFSLNYKHTDENTIFFDNINISPLKYSPDSNSIGYYCEVSFDCFYKGEYRKGNGGYPRFRRTAVVVLKKENEK
jgi:hypothetical protein